jgi:hypothetical protein
VAFVDCVLFSSLETEGPTEDNLALASALQNHGLKAQVLPWEIFLKQPIDCGLIVFQSTWGYYKNYPQFKALIDQLENLKIEVWNPLEVIRWNSHKRYLIQLEKKGVKIVPSILWEKGKSLKLIETAEHLESDLLVIKPAIGASAYHTQLVDLAKIEEQSSEIQELGQSHDLLVQPFVPEVQSEGEYSLVFIDNQFTHCMIKVPEDQDFRVVGNAARKIPCPPRALSAAKKILRLANQEHIYARVDLVMHEDHYLLMELELIEPRLWLQREPMAADLFASAISKRI